MRWMVFYICGGTFSNEDGEPEDAPGGGVAMVAQEDADVGVALHHGSDYYVFDEQYGGWYGLDVSGFIQYLMRPGKKIVKLAETMTTTKYRALLKAVQDDPCLPNKSARFPWEARL